MKKIFIILLVVVAIPLGLTIHHLATKVAPEQYLLEDAKIYVTFDSIKDFYDDIIDLKALEIVLTSDNLKDFYTILTDFKSNKYSDSFVFKEILKLEVFTVLHNDLSPSLIINPGLKGIVSRLFPLFINRLNSEDIEVKSSNIDGREVFSLIYKEESEYFILFDRNLIIITLEKENIKNLLAAKDSGEGYKVKDKLSKLKRYRVKGSILELYTNSGALIPEQEILEFPSLGSVSLNINNEKVDLKAYTKITPLDEKIKGLMDHKPAPIKIVKNLPDTTNTYTAFNFKSFRDVYNVFTLFYKEYLLEDYELLIKSLSSLSSDDLLFSWTGSEAGFFTMETASEPVIFIEISDKRKLNDVVKALDDSLVLNIDNNLVIDSNRISQFKFPKVAEVTMELANMSSTLPYFIVHDGYLLLSMNPELLSLYLTKKGGDELLIRDKTYRSITKRFPKNANLFIYYDLNSTLPRFLHSDNTLVTLFKEYKKGVITATYSPEDIYLSLNAERSTPERTTLFPGYPKKSKKINSPVHLEDITKGATKEFIYTTRDNSLVISDIAGTVLFETEIEEGSYIYSYNKVLNAIDRSGTIYSIIEEGEDDEKDLKLSTYTTGVQNTFPPLIVDDTLILYSSLEKALGFYSLTGDLKGEISSPKTIFNTPALIDNTLFYYPKTLFGTVEARTLRGERVQGWPQNAMGISFSGPIAVEDKIAFLTQKGDLYLWDSNGKLEEGFPLKLNGVFYSPPVSIDNKTIGVINGDGYITTVNLKGKILNERSLERFGGRDCKLKSFNGNLYIYGSTNYIAGLNKKLQMLEGFPVKGHYEPTFYDINGDDYIELISPGYDENLYVYTIR